MITSIDWLKEFTSVEQSPKELAEILSHAGLEAEVSQVPSELKGVVIGYVESTKKHPDADKLKVCMINDGNNIHQVVCGAPNVDTGQKIAFATVGSILPGKIKIKQATIRGVDSSGMICSESELNLSDEHDGIMVLPKDLELGKDFISAYGYRYLSLELDITPNRPDAFSHQGIARDLACATKKKFKPLLVTPTKSNGDIRISINMEDTVDCPRYIAGVVKNINIGPSPEWIIERLKAAGQRSINNVVDISNYVLLEMGHPTHIFDYNAIEGKEVFVRRATKGESLVTLDGDNHKIDENHLLITDGKRPLALAGIMGGQSSAVSDNTHTVLLECAYFDPITIRRSSKSLKLSTDASKRFERGADPDGCVTAFWRVIQLLKEVAGGELASEMMDKYPTPIPSNKVVFRSSELELILGILIDDNEIGDIFDRLGIIYTKKNGQWDCDVPSYRPDITREIDLVEEIARMVGYDNIPSDENIHGPFRFENSDPEKNFSPIPISLSGLGFHQVYSNSLQNEHDSSLFGKSPVKMINPLNKEMAYLRTSLLPGLMKAADYNVKNGTQNFRIFELGHVHERIEKGLEGIRERKYLAGIIYGHSDSYSVHGLVSNEDLYTLKGVLSFLFEKRYKMRMDLIKEKHKGFEYSQTIILNRKKVGFLGRLSLKWISSMNLDIETTLAFEVDLEPIRGMLSTNKKFKQINPYPKISRDLNLVMPVKQETGPIVNMIIKHGKKLIIEAIPINIFIDTGSLGEDMKSVTFSLIFQHSSKTLEDKDVNPVIEEIIHIAQKEFLAKLRA